ncbi:MAG: hypothetical protein ACI4EI_13590 [Muricoprocola sp.]
MSSKTKIILLKKRELIYTALFLLFGIILFLLMALMFRPTASKTSTPKKTFTSGIYTSSFTLGDSAMELAVRIDHNTINSIHMQNLSDSVAAMYPLMEPALDKIAVQVCETQSTNDIYYEAATQYTSQMLLSAIEEALNIASSH